MCPASAGDCPSIAVYQHLTNITWRLHTPQRPAPGQAQQQCHQCGSSDAHTFLTPRCCCPCCLQAVEMAMRSAVMLGTSSSSFSGRSIAARSSSAASAAAPRAVVVSVEASGSTRQCKKCDLTGRQVNAPCSLLTVRVCGARCSHVQGAWGRRADQSSLKSQVHQHTADCMPVACRQQPCRQALAQQDSSSCQQDWAWGTAGAAACAQPA